MRNAEGTKISSSGKGGEREQVKGGIPARRLGTTKAALS